MKFNELAIENAILETETIKSLRKLEEKQRVDEVIMFAPWAIAAAQWAISAAVAVGVTWLTEEAVSRLVTNWQESSFRPNPNMIPENTRVVIQDNESGNRLNFRYRGGQWQRQDIGGSNTWAPVSNEDMADVLEKAGRQRRSWWSRLFGGRRRYNGLGYDFSRVSQDEFNRAVLWADLSSNRNLRNSNHFREVQSEYDRIRTEHPELYDNAKARTLARANTGGWVGTFANLGLGLGLLWYEINEMEDVYRQRVENGSLPYEQYQELHDNLVDATKNIIAQIIGGATAASLVGIGTGFIISRIPVIRSLKGWPRTITASVITTAALAASVNEGIKGWLIDFLADTYLLDNTPIEGIFEERLDDLIRLLGLEDIVDQQGGERQGADAAAAGDLDAPAPSGGVDFNDIFGRN